MLDRSPLELLAAYAICLTAGFVVKMAMDHWANKVMNEAKMAADNVCTK